VQDALIAVLLDHGAAVDAGLVNTCLANGRGGAAAFLAARGAPLDLEGAAGVGRLDRVEAFFDDAANLKAHATPNQLKSGFTWACEFGRTNIVEFLLKKGVDVGARVAHHGQTGLHWAALGAHLDTVALLLEQGAPVDVKDEAFAGTPLGWALHGWSDPPPGTDRDRYPDVAALLVAAGASVSPEWLADQKIRADARMLAAVRGEAGGRQ
jgi:hypothetical protein